MRTGQVVEVVEVEPVWITGSDPGTVPSYAPAAAESPAAARSGAPSAGPAVGTGPLVKST